MNALLKIPGGGKLVSFYRCIYLNQPRLTALAGAVLVLSVGAVHLIEAPQHFRASPYLGALFVASAAGADFAATGIVRGATVRCMARERHHYHREARLSVEAAPGGGARQGRV